MRMFLLTVMNMVVWLVVMMVVIRCSHDGGEDGVIDGGWW